MARKPELLLVLISELIGYPFYKKYEIETEKQKSFLKKLGTLNVDLLEIVKLLLISK